MYSDFKDVVRFLIQNDISFDSQMDLENHKIKFKVDDTSLNNSQKNMLKSYIIKEDFYEVTYTADTV
jgi:predicted AlkP superfamily pyrophosphatase or phosphodiesterase